MDDDLDAFVEAACRPLLEEWELRASSPPPLRDKTDDFAQGGSAFELDSVALQFAAHVADGDASAAGRTAQRRALALPARALVDSASPRRCRGGWACCGSAARLALLAVAAPRELHSVRRVLGPPAPGPQRPPAWGGIAGASGVTPQRQPR